jgi:enoyl-CoA hydratase
MSEAPVLVERDGHVLIVTLNRPEKRNAINCHCMCLLADAWQQLEEDPELRVAILTGKGNTFCAGMDLGEILLMRQPEPANEWIARTREDTTLITRGWLKTNVPSKPIILAAEGFARAGGTEILQGTTLRVAGESAVFGVTEVQRGLFPMMGSAVRLRRQIPYAVAAEMLLTGDDITAQRAYEVGLINYVVPDGQAVAKAKEIAARIADNGPLAVKAIQSTLRDTDMLTDTEAFEIEGKYGQAVFASEDAQEGPRAFLEKRKPQFKGR